MSFPSIPRELVQLYYISCYNHRLSITDISCFTNAMNVKKFNCQYQLVKKYSTTQQFYQYGCTFSLHVHKYFEVLLVLLPYHIVQIMYSMSCIEPISNTQLTNNFIWNFFSKILYIRKTNITRNFRTNTLKFVSISDKAIE